MKIKMCIFGKIISVMAAFVIAGGACVAPASAVIDNTGCDRENNLYINPDLALCSTHVYNIGKTENPQNSSERQLMQDVVALKTTLMTQQMYSQYEILATTVKRMRTQLQKEILLAKLKTASATANGGSYNDSTNGSSSYNSGDRNVVLSGAKNCQALFRDSADILNCEYDNLDRVLENASSNRSDAKRQLEKDLAVIDRIVKVEVTNNNKISKVGVSTTVSDCQSNLGKASGIENCVYSVRTEMSNTLRNLTRSNTQQRNSNI